MLKVIGGVPDGEYKAIASGTLPSGNPVVVNSDGTVSVVEETSVSGGLGSPVVFDTQNAFFIESVYDSANQKTVVFYQSSGGNNGGTASVATVSGTSVSYGTSVIYSESVSSAYYTAACYDSANEKVVVFYHDVNTNFGYATVGTVSGTSITFGSAVTFITNLASASYLSATYDEASGKVVIFYKSASSSYGRCKVGTVSGTTISFGSEIVFNSGSTDYIASTYDSNAQKIVIVYRDQGNSNYGTGVVGTVSGSSISFGTEEIFSYTNNDPIEIAYHAGEGRVVVIYKNGGNSNYGTALTGLVSGTSIAFGSPVVFNSATTGSMAIDYDSAAQKMVVTYRDQGNSNYGTYVTATVSGENITFSSETVFESAYTDHTWVTFDASSNSNLISYRDSGNTDNGTGIVLQNGYSSTNLTAENYIGMSKGVVSNTPSVIGSETIFENAATRYTATAYDTTNNKIVIAYEDDANSDYGTAIVGTVSGNTISFGTPVVFESANTDQQAIVFDENAGKVLITYRDNSDAKGYGIVGTVSGTSISFGSATQFESTNNPVSMNMSYDPDQQKCLLVWRANGASDVGRAKVATISGTSVSFGSLTTFFNGPIFSPKVAYDTNQNKHVVCFVDDQNTDRGLAIIGTVSGTSVTFGSTVIFDSTVTSNNVIAYDSSVQKVVIAYTDESNSNEGTAVVGTVSGNSISFGSPIVFTNPGNFQDSSITYDSGAEKIVISFRNADNTSKGTVISGKVAGNSITFDTEEIFNSGGTTDYISSAYDPDQGKVVIAYQDSPNADRGTCVVYQTGYTNRNPVADGANARLNIIGSVSENQLSLTAGEKYYVQTDGTLSTTAGTPSVLAGTAISATKLVVKT